jgi:hypothetical protein
MMHSAYGEVEGLRDGRLLSMDRGWLNPLGAFHGVIYLLSAAAILYFVLGRRLDPHARAFGVIVLAGIVINALVCGGISEPADRYGARVAFLLPMVAVMLLAASKAYRPGSRGAEVTGRFVGSLRDKSAPR